MSKERHVNDTVLNQLFLIGLKVVVMEPDWGQFASHMVQHIVIVAMVDSAIGGWSHPNQSRRAKVTQCQAFFSHH